MAEEKSIRLGAASRKLNVGHATIVEFLTKKGLPIENNVNAKLTSEQYGLLSREYAGSASEKVEASQLTIGYGKQIEPVEKPTAEVLRKKVTPEQDILITNLGSSNVIPQREKEKEQEKEKEKEREKEKEKEVEKEKEKEKEREEKKKEAETVRVTETKKETETVIATAPEKEKEVEKKIEKKEIEAPRLKGPKVLGTIDLSDKKKHKKREEPVPVAKAPAPPPPPPQQAAKVVKTEAPPVPPELIKATAGRLQGLKVLDTIKLVEKPKQPQPPPQQPKSDPRRPRKRIPSGGKDRKQKPPLRPAKVEPTVQEIQQKVRDTLDKLNRGQKKTTGAKYRKEKRLALSEAEDVRLQKEQELSKTLRVTEFISANDLASLMNVSVTAVISTCMGLGMFVSINQRLDAEAITVIALEFGFEVHFTTEEETDQVTVKEAAETLQERPPIVTIMGHVDHGKTSLLDYIRQTQVTASEAGGITQHIGAYTVTTKSKHTIAFLDTPGHEAFTAMRARGAKLTDIAIIVVAADDDVMPQTKEAINHAQVAGVPIIIAINKIDKPGANIEKVKESLSKINILVEDWGGKYQCQPISAKKGTGIDDLLEKILLEAELLNLQANPQKLAVGSIIEASLDKGRGFLSTLMVQAGTLRVGDAMVSGQHHGRVKAMYDALGNKVTAAGPSTPVQVLGLDGAPQAGEKFLVTESDREARELANKRGQILREQSIRTRKHITLDEIGRRLAIGSFKQLNVIVKGDVDGSVEALSDSLLKLSTPKVAVSIIHKAIGQISESDVLLASASDAIIVGFQVRPSPSARRLAEKEEIEIRLYSIIYDAIDEIKAAIEGMLEKEMEEIIVGNAEVRAVYKVSKVGTIAGCMVTEGFVKRANPIRLIRDGIVVYSGKLSSLKRFKDDASEVKSGYDCGIGIESFNDIKQGDVIESYEMREVKKM